MIRSTRCSLGNRLQKESTEPDLRSDTRRYIAGCFSSVVTLRPTLHLDEPLTNVGSVDDDALTLRAADSGRQRRRESHLSVTAPE